MQEETFKHKLDLYYLATLVYLITFILYVAVRGSLIEDRFEVVLQDPIVYLLAAVTVISLLALAITAILRRTVIVGPNTLTFRTRFKTRVFRAEDVEWIAFRRENPAMTRGDRAYPSVRIKLHSRRRRLRLRPGNFERSSELSKALRRWAEQNNVMVRTRRGTAGV